MPIADPIVIVGMGRTPIGNFQGAFSGTPATALGSAAISAAVEGAGVAADEVNEVLMGCVLPAGLGQAPARQAARGAGIADAAPCATVNKVCGSGMKTVMMGHDALAAGSADIVVAGGMESMTNAPYMLPGGRGGMRFGHSEVLDHMAYDGLEDAYDRKTAMGVFAEKTAREMQFSREEQDAYAIESLTRAQGAVADGTFQDETVPVTVKTRKGETIVSEDEKPGLVKTDKIPALRPAFEANGTVTAGNASAISDGAAAVVLMRLSEAERRGATPIAKIVAHASHAQAPEWFTTAPVDAIQKVIEKAGWSKTGPDLYEINEAFAVVALAAIRELSLDRETVNVNGGAIALGHPIGASGTRIIVTLLAEMQRRRAAKGVASLCIGGGEATAIAFERMS